MAKVLKTAMMGLLCLLCMELVSPRCPIYGKIFWNTTKQGI